MKCQIPYGSGALELVLPDEKVAGVLGSSVAPSQGNEDELVLEAMANPYGGKSLKELAVGKKTCAIIISDHTRPVPSKHIIPFMLAELREGNPDIEITLLVATGFHRPTITDELEWLDRFDDFNVWQVFDQVMPLLIAEAKVAPKNV